MVIEHKEAGKDGQERHEQEDAAAQEGGRRKRERRGRGRGLLCTKSTKVA